MAAGEVVVDASGGAAAFGDRPHNERLPAAQVADLTGIVRHGRSGDRLETWPRCLRLITRRTQRPANKLANFGEHLDWEYSAFVTQAASKTR